MKYVITLFALVILSGCVSHHDREINLKKTLCIQFGMEYMVFQLPGVEEDDVICRDKDTGELVYMELIPENQVRPNKY